VNECEETMLISAKTARDMLSNFPVAIACFAAIDSAALLYPAFYDQVDSWIINSMILTFSVIGLMIGVFVKYRSALSIYSSIFLSTYSTALFLLLGCGIFSVSGAIDRKMDYGYIAMIANVISAVAFFLAGAMREAKTKQGYQGTYLQDRDLENYIDFDRMEIDPKIRHAKSKLNEGSSNKMSSVKIAMIGSAVSANVMLVAQIFGLNYSHLIWAAALGMAFAIDYLNFKYFGPSAFRLHQLHKLQNKFSTKFKNSDFDEIQELRRTFFLSRWLMKDYRPASAPPKTA
jgi:hypothetical protein